MEIGADITKIPFVGEISNVPLLREFVELGLPVIMQSRMSDWNEIDRAVEILNKLNQFCILQCSSLYPCPPEKSEINVLLEIQSRHKIPIGLSDHTLTGATAIAVVVMGTKVIEKYFTISKYLYGHDAQFSLETCEF